MRFFFLLFLAACSDAPIEVATDAGLAEDAIADVAIADHSAPPPTCDVFADEHATERAACAFHAGALGDATLGDLAALRASITHVVVLTQENHSVDAMFGTTGHGIEGIPKGYANVDAYGTTLHPSHLATACPADPAHDRAACVTGWDNGKMDGFARASGDRGQIALGYYTDADHPFYTWLATTFATSDRYFAAVLDKTSPNRHYLYAAQNTPGKTLFDELDAKKIAWHDYTPDSGLEGALGFRVGSPPEVLAWTDFFPAAKAGTLAPVTFIDMPGDEHPSHSLHDGENDVRYVMTALMASPLWPHMAVLMTYDEGGGFFDHVPPPKACVAVPNDAAYDRLGVRVPLFVVSPYARASFVSHAVHSHTSILRFIEALFDLPAITARDANSDALLDLFDFACPAFAKPPAKAASAHARGC